MTVDQTVIDQLTDTPEPKPAEPKPEAAVPTDKVKIKVNGQEKEVTLQEALALASKAEGADAAFRAAAEARKLEADLKRMANVSGADDTEGIEATRRIWSRQGVSKEDQDARLRELFGEPEVTPNPSGGGKPSSEVERLKAELDELKELVSASVTRQNRDITARLDSGVESKLFANPELKALIDLAPDESVGKNRSTRALNLAKSAWRHEYQLKKGENPDYDPEKDPALVDRAVTSALTFIKDIAGAPNPLGRQNDLVRELFAGVDVTKNDLPELKGTVSDSQMRDWIKASFKKAAVEAASNIRGPAV